MLDFEPDKNYLTSTHKITLDMGVAYIEQQAGKSWVSIADRYWQRKKITVTSFKDSKILRKEALKRVKQLYPDSHGAFFFPYSWKDAIRIAPDPELPDICGCMLGLGGGIYQPDLLLDIRFGVARPWDVNRKHLYPEKGIWYEHLDTVEACSNRDDLDDTYLGKIERQRQAFAEVKEDVGYFIVEKLWDKARKFDDLYRTIGDLAGLPKDHDPSKTKTCH